MGKLYLVLFSYLILNLSCSLHATILNFEDLSHRQDISGSSYHDINWEFGNAGEFSIVGSWMCPDPTDSLHDYFNFPHSGTHNLCNKWGCSEIGFQFPVETFELGVIVAGAYFAVQGHIDSWASVIQAIGYKDDQQVWATEPFIVTVTPQWLAMGPTAVDKVLIISSPGYGSDYGWFGMDDLTFEEVPEPITLLLLTFGAAFIRRRQ